MLVFAPHPDDEVFGCGAAITRCLEKGGSVRVILLTAGADSAESEIARTRLAESRAAAELLGYEAPLCWGYPDRGLGYQESLIERMRQEIESYQADLVLAPSFFEVHPDHRVAARCAFEAVRRLGGERYFVQYEVGVSLRPNLLLDATPVYPRKRAAMACFGSQLVQQPYHEQVEAMNRQRSYTLDASVKLVEAFEIHPAAGLAHQLLAFFGSESTRQCDIPLLVGEAPLVSVLIRAANRDTLRQTLDSVAAQTYPNLEVVVVAAVPEQDNPGEHCGRFPLRFVGTEQRRPRAIAANTALDAGRGEFLLFLDDDDWLEPDHIARLLPVLNSEPSLVAVYSETRCVDRQGQPLSQRFGEIYDPVRMAVGNALPIHSVLFRRSVLASGCRFDTDFECYEDWDFWLQLGRLGNFQLVTGASAVYRLGTQNNSGAQTAAMSQIVADHLKIYHKWLPEMPGERLFDVLQRSLATFGLVREKSELSQTLARVEALHEAAAQQVVALEAELDAARSLYQANAEAHVAQVELLEQEIEAREIRCGEIEAQYAAAQQATRQHIDNLTQQIHVLQCELGDTRASLHRITALFHLKVVEQRELSERLATVEHLRSELSGSLIERQRLAQALGERDRLIHDLDQLVRDRQARAETLYRAVGDIFGAARWRWATRLARLQARAGRLIGASVTLPGQVELPAVAPLPQWRLPDPVQIPEPPPAALPPAVQAVAPVFPETYREFLRCFAPCPELTDEFRRAMRAHIDGFKVRPQITVRLSAHGASPADLLRAVDAVRYQLYPAWELHLDGLDTPALQELIEPLAMSDRRIVIHTVGRLRGNFVLAATVDEPLAELTCYRLALYLIEHNDLKPETAPVETDYPNWLEHYSALNEPSREQVEQAIAALPAQPLISVVMPTYNTERRWLAAAIESVRRQSYTNWELCIADDASTREETRELLRDYAARYPEQIKVHFRSENGHISLASNDALALAGGDYIALLDHDDLLAPDALFWVAHTLAEHPEANIIYSDEDKIDSDGVRCEPYFKPDWNYDLFLGQNTISHLGVYRASLLREIGGFRQGFEGSQDYDLALRAIDTCKQQGIHHIPRVLYHWRILPGSTALTIGEKPYASIAAKRALQEHLERNGYAGEAIDAPEASGMYRVCFELPAEKPLVSLIIPTRDKVELLSLCVDSILEKTRYRAFEIIVVDNGSVEPATLDYLERICREHDNVRVLRDDSPFNYSRLNNAAAALARGEIVGLLNNDLEVISEDWLDEMVTQALRPGVGCVGARLWYPDERLQHGGVLLGLGGVANHAHLRHSRGHPGYFGRAALVQNFSAVTGACLLVRKSIYDQVGGLDERLQVAFNDIDFCLRVREAGYRNLWTPYAELYHHESASRGSEDTPAKKARFQSEIDHMLARWQGQLENDPAYNPNLALYGRDFDLAFPPRPLPGLVEA
ncbi:glycosyltransferase [Chitinimonas lacunae]|uniref:Glycosyltransferase n=1 Tax=Chitinimonas lacunae TaxID=1963018 RepID=A0ABV8MU47_9NEIS